MEIATIPVHRTVLAVDVVGSTLRTNVGRGCVRAAMYALLETTHWTLPASARTVGTRWSTGVTVPWF